MASPVVSLTCTFRTLFSSLRFVAILACSLQFIACSSSKYISKQAKQTILSDSNFTSAHVGISIYDASANKYLYNYQGDKYFIPASNTKLFTCYAAMKHLGDSLVGLRYNLYVDTFSKKHDAIINFSGTGDPTFLHPDFIFQPVFDLFKRNVQLFEQINFSSKFSNLGNGWAWNDYEESDMSERSEMPIYGNFVRFASNADTITVIPHFFYNENIKLFNSELIKSKAVYSRVHRPFENNNFVAFTSSTKFLPVKIPFKTNSYGSTRNPIGLLRGLLEDTLHKPIGVSSSTNGKGILKNIIHSQPTDSLLKPMMHRSDNFFAEQTLLMVSNEMTGVMNDAKIIDSLLKTDFSDLPQKPRWVDGSGLSRYNLFSPNDFIFLLNKMKNDFSWNRITTILATGGEGTLSTYYINLKDRIFAKTGTLSNNVALSGFLVSKKNKTIIFSVLVNNHMGNTTQIRRAVEKFLTSIAEKY